MISNTESIISKITFPKVCRNLNHRFQIYFPTQVCLSNLCGAVVRCGNRPLQLNLHKKLVMSNNSLNVNDLVICCASTKILKGLWHKVQSFSLRPASHILYSIVIYISQRMYRLKRKLDIWIQILAIFSNLFLDDWYCPVFTPQLIERLLFLQ